MNSKTVVLNGARVNYDGSIDYSRISDEVVVYDATPEEKIVERCQGFGIIVTKEMPMPGHIIRALPECVKLICEAGTGFNNIDLDAAKEKGITVCNVPAYSTKRVAHTVFAMILSLFSSIHIQQRMLQRGDHSNFTQCLHLRHEEVNGKVLGIVGTGNIGREVMKLARAFDMTVLAYDKFPGEDSDGITFTDLATVLSSCDVLTLHCPLNEETFHLINKETLALMKPTAYIVNTARGSLVEEKALLQALETGKLAGAALDVQETEPPAEDSPLYTNEKILLTPHMGWKGLETRQRLVSILGDNIKAYLTGAPIHVIV